MYSAQEVNTAGFESFHCICHVFATVDDLDVLAYTRELSEMETNGYILTPEMYDKLMFRFYEILSGGYIILEGVSQMSRSFRYIFDEIASESVKRYYRIEEYPIYKPQEKQSNEKKKKSCSIM